MEYFTSLINSYLSEPHASLLNGILLGIPLTNVTRQFYENLKTVGLVHIVVLSGMNITLLSAIVLSTIVPIVGRRYAMVITIVAIIAFIFFVGIQAPIVRAAIMGILSLIGLLFGRKTIAIYILFLSAIIMIVVSPSFLTSISFQLSFGATLGIILFGKVEESVRPIGQIGRIANYVFEELRISLAAQVFTIPLIFFYFRQISFVAPFSNIMIAWVIAPLMILGLLTLAVGSVNWYLGFVLSWICYGLLQIIIWVVEYMAKIPYAAVKL